MEVRRNNPACGASGFSGEARGNLLAAGAGGEANESRGRRLGARRSLKNREQTLDTPKFIGRKWHPSQSRFRLTASSRAFKQTRILSDLESRNDRSRIDSRISA